MCPCCLANPHFIAYCSSNIRQCLFGLPMRASIQRFQDEGKRFADFANTVLVRCPRCNNEAKLSLEAHCYHFVCPHCAASDSIAATTNACLGSSKSEATFLGFHLWLQIPCTGRTFWALNYRHLAYIRRYIHARHRERTLSKPAAIGRLGFRQTRVRNGFSVVSRLPQWVVSRSARDHVLRAISKLERRQIPHRILSRI